MRYLAVSTMAEVKICEYPDSKKFGAYGAFESLKFRHLARRDDGRDYWEGE